MKYFLAVIFFLGLVYILLPGPGQIEQFSPIPNSVKSNEPGDTLQVPNIAAYFSDFDRKGITGYYRNDFAKMYIFGFITPITLNYAPKEAPVFVRDQQTSTFLEEYSYPLRESIFVNGYEPLVENNRGTKLHTFVGDHIHIDGRYFASKTTLRLYPTLWIIRLIVYVGIWVAAIALYRIISEAFWREKI